MSTSSWFLQYEFFQIAFCSVFLVSMLTGLMSPAVVLKQRSYIGDTIAHLVFPGVVCGYLAQAYFALPLWICLGIGAGVSALAGTLLVSFLERKLAIPADSAAVVVLTMFLGIGVTLLSKNPRAGVDTHRFLFGDVLSQSWGDVGVIAAVLVVVFSFLNFYRRDWNAWAADPEFAAIAGFRVPLLEKLFPVFLTMVVLAGIFSVGGLLMSLLLTFPAVLVAPRTLVSLQTVAVSCAVGLGGFFLSVVFDLPVGSAIVVLGGLLVVGKALLMPRTN